MEVAAEHLAIGMLQHNLVSGEFDAEVFQNVGLYLMPLKGCLIDATHILTEIMKDVGVTSLVGYREQICT